MNGRISCWSQTTAASLDCDCDGDCNVNFDCDCDCDYDLDLDCDVAWQPALGNIKSASKWRLPLFKSAKLKQNVARCCRLRFGRGCTRPSTSHHLTRSLSPLSPAPVGSSDWLFDSIRLISHKANAPQQLERGEARQGKEGGRGSRIHMMRKTASKCKCCTGNCPGSCYPLLHLPPPLLPHPSLIHPECK